MTIREAAPDAEETIKYQMPTFMLKGNLVHFAAFKKHIGFYPVPTGIEAFKDELSAYKQGKGSVQFPLDQPMPYDLIRRIVIQGAGEPRKGQRPRTGKPTAGPKRRLLPPDRLKTISLAYSPP